MHVFCCSTHEFTSNYVICKPSLEHFASEFPILKIVLWRNTNKLLFFATIRKLHHPQNALHSSDVTLHATFKSIQFEKNALQVLANRPFDDL
jgi:hypothetical protein